MGIYCTYFISINPACLPWSHPEREYCNICSVLATPDPRYGPANLYAGPRSLGNLHPSIHIYLKFLKIILNLAALERLELAGHCFARIYSLHSISQI